jgi:hypothetical protein
MSTDAGPALVILLSVRRLLLPGSFSIGGSVAKLSASDLIYFTFTVLTRTGFGDVTPVLPLARDE